MAARIGSLYGIIPQTLSRESRKKPPESLETYEAFLRFYHHATILSPQTFAETLSVLEQAVRREPESGFAWSLLAFLYGQSYTLQLSPMESPLEQALVAAQKGAALEPENQITRAALAHVHFFRNERELFLPEAETALALNPNAPGHHRVSRLAPGPVWGVGAGTGHPEKRHGVESPLPRVVPYGAVFLSLSPGEV